MQKNTILIPLLLLVTAVETSAFDQSRSIRVDMIEEKTIRNLVAPQVAKTKLLNTTRIEEILLDSQSFSITSGNIRYYWISLNRKSQDMNLTTCSTLLLRNNGEVITSLDTAGPDHESRYWACDYVEAMSFKDRYPDGSIQVIAIYLATPPSNERFTLPVIMKLDLKKPSLSIDEALTKKLEDKSVKTIDDARRVLQKYRKGR